MAESSYPPGGDDFDVDEENIFDHIEGHNGAKAILRSALRDGDVHVLMVGPPASGKSAFMMALEDNVPGVMFRESSSMSKARLQSILIEDPPIMLLDELDALSKGGYDALSLPMEHGRVQKETEHESYDIDIGTQFIASANSTDPIPDNILSRMRPIYFEEYELEKFHDVCETMLIDDDSFEWVKSETEARKVAKVTHDVTGKTDPRAARDIAKLAQSEEEVETIAKALHDPDADIDEVELYPSEIEQTKEEVGLQHVRMNIKKEIDQYGTGSDDLGRRDADENGEDEERDREHSHDHDHAHAPESGRERDEERVEADIEDEVERAVEERADSREGDNNDD